MEDPSSLTRNYPATKIDLTVEYLLVTATWINSIAVHLSSEVDLFHKLEQKQMFQDVAIT
jgi:hypothetical protein